MPRLAALAAILLLSSTVNATPYRWPNPLNADVYGLSSPSPQSIAIPWSQTNQRYQFSGGTWNLTISAASDGYFPISLLDPPAPMRITDASSNLIASFDVFDDDRDIYADRTFTTDPNINVNITSRGLVPEPVTLAPMLLAVAMLRARRR